MNQLILGDCLEVLKNIEDESVDLIYLDPPFFSNRNYEVIWGDEGEKRSFQDRWAGGVDHYITWLKERVQEMHRILKPTGSIFLHCDWHANSEIRVFILNKLFGYEKFRSQIIWKRHNAHNDAKKKMPVLTDTIWYYSKSDKFTYHPVYIQLSEKHQNNFYKHRDTRGIYSLGDLTNTKAGGYMYDYKGYAPNQNGWRCPLETMKKLDEEDLIHFPKKKTGRLRIKRYLQDSKGKLLGEIWADKQLEELTDEEFDAIYNKIEIDNIWEDIQNVQGSSKEKIGYPTQKPEKLLERIIEMASNENDVILDPFVGGGTTVAVADRLNRQWIGIDQSVQAVKVTEFRLNLQQGKQVGKTANMFAQPFTVTLHKYDYDTLRYADAFEFESWIVQQFGGFPNKRQRGDLGIDGRKEDAQGQPIQVKRSDNIGRNVIDNFLSACRRYDKNLFDKNQEAGNPVGFIIAFSFGKGAVKEVARLKNSENVIIDLVSVESIVPIAQKPTLQIEVTEIGTTKEVKEIEFIAKAQSKAGIEFYAWDFTYNGIQFLPSILLDKKGKQSHKFKAGTYQIAVKVVDNEGLESIEVIKLKINGGIKISN